MCNTDGKAVTETLGFASDKTPYRIDLNDGELYEVDCEKTNGKSYITCTLLRGEGIMLLFTNEKQEAKKQPVLVPLVELKWFHSFVNRQFEVDEQVGMKNTYYSDGKNLGGLGEWDCNFSGEVTYQTKLPEIPESGVVLDLGEVRCAAKVYVNGNKVAESTMPPYRVPLKGVKTGDTLKVVVSNTSANAIRCSKFFEHQEAKHIGSYHERMLGLEKLVPAGGLIGPVWLLLEKE